MKNLMFIINREACNVRGSLNDTYSTIKIPNDLLIHNDLPNTPKTLINVIFPTMFSETIENDSAILTPKNSDCDVINSIAIRKFSKETPIINLHI